MKIRILAASALMIAGISLAACDQGSEPAADAAPDGMPGVTVTNARLILPAVKGNPAAVYFDLSYSSDQAAALRGASVQGAKSAMIHEYFEWDKKMEMGEAIARPLKKGETLKFEPGGLHVMAMDLDDSVQSGGKAEVTLTFAGGDKFSFMADVQPAGAER